MNEQDIRSILTECRTIAVVGLSPKPGRDSLMVAQVMQGHGYRIVPVNPQYAGTEILGERCYATLAEAAAALGDTKIDMVNCFRRAEDIPPIADEAIAIKAPVLWMQLGISNEAAAAKARAAGMKVVMNRCLKIDYAMLMR